MSKKRLGRWVIVLFLLAALPGMTAVMAQGQEPAVKEMPAESVTPAGPAEWGETDVNYSVWEVEPNDTKATARVVDLLSPPNVIGHDLYNGDVDWYKFYIPATPTSVLINVDAQLNGAATDTVVKLFDSSGSTTPMVQNDDMGGAAGLDSLLFAVLKVGWYYVQISDFGQPCTQSCNYDLIISRPILISASATGLGSANIGGIPFRSEDILAFQPLTNDHNGQWQTKWVLFFDGSDVGITKPVVNIGLGWVGDGKGTLTVGFGANQVWEDWQGLNRTFTPWDWAQFAVERVGPNTLLWINELGNPGVEYHDGYQLGLTTAAEKVDAFDLNAEYAASPAWTANIFQSTTGAATVPTGATGSVKAADEDLLWSSTWEGLGWWYTNLYFDGSKVAGLAAEDIFAADYEPSANRMFLTILGTGNVLGHAVTQKDIFWLNKSGNNWIWGGMLHLPDYGWNYNLDAIEWGGN